MSDPSAGKNKQSPMPWQREHRPESTQEDHKAPGEEDEALSTAKPASDDEGGRAELLDQASKFAAEDSVRGESYEKRRSFLLSKGLTDEEVEQVLGGTQSESPKDVSGSSITPGEETRDLSSPPIIVYPEFLANQARQSSKSPLLSGKTISGVIYAAVGAFVTAHGANKYLVGPMVDALNEARQTVAETASTNLTKLNSRLEDLVSEVPASALRPHGHHVSGDVSPSLSVDSDPTELFHVDMGTQTSPKVTSRANSSFEGEGLFEVQKTLEERLQSQSSQLSSLASQLAELVDGEDDTSTSDNQILENALDLRSYLDELDHKSTYSRNSQFTWSLGGNSAAKSTDEDDSIAQMKSEIRSIKGLLLSARNFPTAAGVKAR